jgi:hypothetical protein
MAVPPANQVPTISPAEMQILVSRTGLVLNPGQVADLVLAWRQLATLIAAMPRDRPLADDMALVFRPPPAPQAPPAAQRAKPAGKSAVRRPPATSAAAARKRKAPGRATPKR